MCLTLSSATSWHAVYWNVCWESRGAFTAPYIHVEPCTLALRAHSAVLCIHMSLIPRYREANTNTPWSSLGMNTGTNRASGAAGRTDKCSVATYKLATSASPPLHFLTSPVGRSKLQPPPKLKRVKNLDIYMFRERFNDTWILTQTTMTQAQTCFLCLV